MNNDELRILELKGQLQDLEDRKFATQQEKRQLERQLATGKIAELPYHKQPVDEIVDRLDDLARPVPLEEREQASSSQSAAPKRIGRRCLFVKSVSRPLVERLEEKETIAELPYHGVWTDCLDDRLAEKECETKAICPQASSSESTASKKKRESDISVSLESVSRPLAEFAIESPSGSPKQLKARKTIEFSPTLRRYTVEKIGLREDQLKVSQLPYNLDGYIFGKIRLVSVKEDYIPFIPELFHKNIVAQYGLLETKNHGYFLMLERTVGTSVQKHLEENKPSEEVTRSWLLDASRALNYCHSLNFPYGELSLDRLHIHGSRLKLEHPAVRRNYGQGAKQDLLELCKLVLTSSDDQLKSLSEKIESGTIKTASEVCRFLEELVPKATFEKGAKSLKRVAPCEEAVSVKAAKKPRSVTTFDPDLQIVPENVEDICGQKETTIGTLVELDTEHVSGQGHYVSAVIKLEGYVGPALVKYLGGRSDLWHQARDYSKFGISNPAVAEAVENASYLKNSEREISFAGKLSHPNIVRILGYVSPDRTLENINGIIMEGAPQGTLDTYAARHPMSNQQYRSLSLQLASAMEYCHSVQGIIHRDIRPENIYVYDGGTTLKIGNFGYARINDNDNPMTATKGENIFYCAPEMISTGPLADYGFSADVYSFAMTLWSMCHKGRKPFKDELKKSLRKFRAYLEEGNRPEFRADLPEAMTVLISKCWITESEDVRRPTFTNIVKLLQQN